MLLTEQVRVSSRDGACDMTYYHVCITPKSSQSYRDVEVKLDLTLEELEERFIAPYRRGNSITVNGRVYPLGDIERIRINETRKDSEAIYPAVVEEMMKEMDYHGEYHRLDEWVIMRDIADSGNEVTDKFITGPPGSESDSGVAGGQYLRPPTDAREVFVVHGRNEQARKAMFEFLRAIGLHPLEWSEAVRATGRPIPYIGDILNAAFSRAHAVVVLLTPDDEARLSKSLRVDNDPPHEVELSGQARPNVLFEAGMAMGRDEDRTVLVEVGEMRPFSDIAGRHVIRLDDSSQRRQELAQRLEAAGCPVNLDGTDWHSAGDFDGALE